MQITQWNKTQCIYWEDEWKPNQMNENENHREIEKERFWNEPKKRRWEKNAKRQKEIESNQIKFSRYSFPICGGFFYVHRIKYYTEYNVLYVSVLLSGQVSQSASQPAR